MNTRTLYLFLFIALSYCAPQAMAQSKKAIKYYDEAIQHKFNGKEQEMIAALEKAVDKAPEYYKAWIMLGQSQYKAQNYQAAHQAYLQAENLKPGTAPSFGMGESLFKMERYEEAQVAYQKYLSYLSTPNSKLAKTAKRRIANCEFAQTARLNPVDFQPIALGPGINTHELEYDPVLSTDGKKLIYTKLIGNKGNRKERLYMSTFRDGQWQQGIALPAAINSGENIGAPCLSPDGKILFFTACNRSDGFGGCDIYFSVLTEDGWTPAQNLGSPVNTRHWDAHPSLSPDGQQLFFSSNRPNGKGLKDIWVSNWMGDHWSRPQNVSALNSEADDLSPNIHLDNQSLFFSSNGWPGLGDYDFFVSVKRDGEWTTPLNLGYPINSSKREYSLKVARDGVSAYYATDSYEQAKSMDIYRFDLPPQARAKAVQLWNISICNEQGDLLPNSELHITDLVDGSTHLLSNSGTGHFSALLPVDARYALQANAPGYMMQSEQHFVMGLEKEKERSLTLRLNKIEVDQELVLHNIYFQTDQASLQENSYQELEQVLQFLKSNPGVKIEIAGHTDSVGGQTHNMELSQKRAEAVMNFLTENDIPVSRLYPKGYGSSKPIAENDSEKGRAQNRRTSIKILSLN